MRFAHRKDENHNEVADHLRGLGFSVEDTHMIGDGFPDILVARDEWFTALVEIKDGEKIPSKQKLTPDEVEFHRKWKGRIITANSPQDAAEQLLNAWHFAGRGKD